jgi:hypothetical protein
MLLALLLIASACSRSAPPTPPAPVTQLDPASGSLRLVDIVPEMEHCDDRLARFEVVNSGTTPWMLPGSIRDGVLWLDDPFLHLERRTGAGWTTVYGSGWSYWVPMKLYSVKPGRYRVAKCLKDARLAAEARDTVWRACVAVEESVDLCSGPIPLQPGVRAKLQ